MIAIIDYGFGNLRSAQKGFEYVGHIAEITRDPKQIQRADKIVLPGVGAFCDAMNSLRDLGLIPLLTEAAAQGKPLLGICLGMQLLMEYSEEGGRFKGLGLIPGEVRRIWRGPGMKVPHMGWNVLHPKSHPLLKGVDREAHAYFVHSYHVVTDESYVIGTTNYGTAITAAVAKNQVFGLQFHPEKSGDNGLMILKNFGGLL